MNTLSRQLSDAKKNLGRTARVVVVGKRYDYPIYFAETYVGAYLSAKDSDRGNDLADGAPNDATWDRIVRDIMRCERDA